MDQTKEPTINHMKRKRDVPEEARSRSKEFARLRKAIRNAMQAEPQSIPDIAAKTGLPTAVVTYTLMTLRRYGEIEETTEIDDTDHYLYSLKTKG